MPLIQIDISLAYQVGQTGADFILNIEGAKTKSQTIACESLSFSQNLFINRYVETVGMNRFLRFHAFQGELEIKYLADIQLRHLYLNSTDIEEVPINELPNDVLTYLYPSRYCQSDRLTHLAMKQFGGLTKGYDRIAAIQEWVRRNVTFEMKSSNSSTSALETLSAGTGVCRDFAHLMIALCRALGIPARYTTGIDYGADPALGPPDFHAYVEVYLRDQWVIFDPSGVTTTLGLIRIGTGRDAADVSFASIYGDVSSSQPCINMKASEDSDRCLSLPTLVQPVLSTDY
jgi:transglutaminase-like putative cysteine protease